MNVGSEFYDPAMEELISSWEKRLMRVIEDLDILSDTPVPPFGASLTVEELSRARLSANATLWYVRSGRPSIGRKRP